MPNKKTYGEELFECYLTSQDIRFKHEPAIESKTALIDYVVEHPSHGQILFEVKDIHHLLPCLGPQVYNPYEPIRQHIEEGQRKFKQFADELCVLVLVAKPPSYVDLNEPHVMLGAMYGDLVWTIPVDPETGEGDSSSIMNKFLVGSGKMLRMSRNQNTRIAAIVSLHSYSTFAKEAALFIKTDDGRSVSERREDVYEGRVNIDVEPIVCVTVWENAVAKRKLPHDLFRGEMDAWWTANDDGTQGLTFVGTRRQSLGIDNIQ